MDKNNSGNKQKKPKYRVWDSLVSKMLKVVGDFELKMPIGCYLMQNIGLKDKNGKDIYEGDIVMLTNKEGKKRLMKITSIKDSKLLLSNICEVVGNIYQYPLYIHQLLKELKPGKGQIYENNNKS